MNDNRKKYLISSEALDNVPIGSPEESDFQKYKADNLTTTWCTIVDEEMHFLTQFNKRGGFYAGYQPEPYKVFLNYAYTITENTVLLEKKFKECILTEFNLNSNFKLKILHQEDFDKYLMAKINGVVFLIMSIESYLNTIIPFNLNLDGKLKTEIENKFSIKEKFSLVIPKFKEIINQREYQNLYSEILQLNRTRNNFVHLKTSQNQANFESYIEDFQGILKLDLSKEYDGILKIINLIDNYKNISL